MPPEDAPETDEQREERRERHLALRDAKRNGGHVRSLLLRDEDYVAYDTRVWDMTGDAFVVFWLTYLHGGECFEPFELIPGHNHLWRAVIVRRKGSSTDEDPNLVEPVILVDLDACDAIVRIPPEVWRYAFEKRRKQNALDLNPLLQVDFNTTVQVILASARAGFLIKGPMYLLLVLAQSRVSLRDFSLQDADALSTEWAKVWTLQQECDATVAKSRLKPKQSPEAAPETASGSAPPVSPGLDEFAITIEFPKARAKELLDIFAEGNHIVLPNYAREMWALVPFTPEGEPLVRSQDEINPDALVDGSRFFEGDPFKWAPLALRDPETSIFASWADTPRIVRCNLLGGKYYLNASRAAWARRPEIKWADMENMRMFPPRRTKIHPARLGREGNPFNLRTILPDEIAVRRAEITPFAVFWGEVFGRELRLIEHRDGWYLYRDNQPVEVDGKTGFQETDVIIKDLSFPLAPAQVLPYYGGLQAYLDLFSDYGYPARWFILYPWNEIVEWDTDILRAILKAWGGPAILDIEQVCKRLIRVREDALLDVDISLGDLLGNEIVTAHLVSADGATSIIDAWEYDPDEGHYVARTSGSADLAAAKALLQRVRAGEEEPDIIALLHVSIEKLKRDHPTEYAALVAAATKVLPLGDEGEIMETGAGEGTSPGENDAEEELDNESEVEGESTQDTGTGKGTKEEEDEDDEEGNEIGDWKDDAEVIEEDDYITWYMDREGFEFSEEPDDSTFDDDYGHEYELTEEDLADAPTMPAGSPPLENEGEGDDDEGEENDEDNGEGDDDGDGDGDNEGDDAND